MPIRWLGLGLRGMKLGSRDGASPCCAASTCTRQLSTTYNDLLSARRCMAVMTDAADHVKWICPDAHSHAVYSHNDGAHSVTFLLCLPTLQGIDKADVRCVIWALYTGVLEHPTLLVLGLVASEVNLYQSLTNGKYRLVRVWDLGAVSCHRGNRAWHW